MWQRPAPHASSPASCSRWCSRTSIRWGTSPMRLYGSARFSSRWWRVPDKPRLLVLNQYYWPGLEATAYLLSQLLGALSADFEITVITGRLAVHAPRAERVVHDGVRIIRVRSTAFDRSGMLGRAANYLTYLLQTLRVALVSRRPDVMMCMTDPPVIGDVALVVARRFR